MTASGCGAFYAGRGVKPAIEVWERLPEGAWRHREFRAGETAEIEALPARLPVDEVYLVFRP
jgi:hypothetical protein